MTKHVMIVDDSAMIRTQVSRALTGAGFTAIEAIDGEDAWEKLEGIDFMICDVNMPRMSGLELLEKMSESRTDNPPVLMLTTEAQPELIRQARQMGAIGWMVKPCQPDLLIEAVKNMVG